MEAEFLSFGLDVIGLGVFNYDFGSVTTESPVIKAVYGLLKGACNWQIRRSRPCSVCAEAVVQLHGWVRS